MDGRSSLSLTKWDIAKSRVMNLTLTKDNERSRGSCENTG